MVISWFVVIILAYILACYLGVRFYFYMVFLVQNSFAGPVIKIIYSYLLFALFVLLEVPFAIFFPLWVFDKLGVAEPAQTITVSLIIFGCVVLAVSIGSFKGWGSSSS